MDMAGHQHLYITSVASQRKILFKSTKKVIPGAVIKKNILVIQTPGDDMMNRNGDIESFVSRYAAMITTCQINMSQRLWGVVGVGRENPPVTRLAL